MNRTASFDITGDRIYLGSNEGLVTIIDTVKKMKLQQFSIVESGFTAAIKGFAFARDGKQFLVNAADKLIRLYDVKNCTLYHELSEAVTRVQWKSCHFSGDDYIVGGSADKQEHKIYIWSREFGQLQKILEGPSSGTVLDIAIHPTRSIIASVTTSGLIHIWSRQITESWSAYAPGFTELEENEEYIEKEDEFDIEDDHEKKKQEIEEEDDSRMDVDFMKVDEDDFVLPIYPTPETFTPTQPSSSPKQTHQKKRRH